MAYSYQDRLDHLGVRKKEVDSAELQYRRPGEALNPITQGTVEYHQPEGYQEEGQFHVETELIAFTFDADALEVYATDQFPKRGDTITYNTVKYAILPMDDDGTHYRYTTSSRKRIRVFTREQS